MTPEDQTRLDKRLIVYAEIGCAEMVQTHLAAGANVHAEDDRALRLAADNRHTEIVQALLAAGADVHAGNDRALRRAASQKGFTQTVQVLVANGADVHADDDLAVRLAAWWGRTETVTVLLGAGADVHAQNDYALCNAVRHGFMETVEVLAKHIFAPDSWRGKSRAEIEAGATALFEKIEAFGRNPLMGDHLPQAASILRDCALTCWEQVRPAPPRLQISSRPAQPMPL